MAAGFGSKPTKLLTLFAITGGALAAWAAVVSPKFTVPWLIPPAADDVPAPVFTPVQAMRTFRLRDGFTMDLVAAEPVVRAPVAMHFDEDGRLWVVEMQGYMPDADATGEGTPTSRIVVLEDTNSDGTFEKHTVFADGLVLPRSVASAFGGALVVAPPDLLFLRDTDGDGRADERRVLKTGVIGIENPEHAPNALMFGLDGWWHLSQCDFDFKFYGPDDPRPIETRPTPVHGQWGMTQDELGRFYYTPNSTPLLMDLVPKHLAVRDGKAGALPSVGYVVAKDGTTWPIRPTPGVNRGYLANVLRPDGTLASITAACGPVMNRTLGFGDDYYRDVFICEPAGNLVKHLNTEWSINIPTITNPATDGEFLASTDERFRPVWATFGPDGALYIADMYRGVIQHKTYLTPFLREQVKKRVLETPLECGRIWRIRRIRPSHSSSSKTVQLSKLSTVDLVRIFAESSDQQSDHAFRLLLERAELHTAELLHQALAATTDPVITYRLLHAVDALDPDTTLTVDANEPLLRRFAFEHHTPSDSGIVEFHHRLRNEPDVWVRTLAALTIDRFGSDMRPAILAAAGADTPPNPHLTAAICLAARSRELAVINETIARVDPSEWSGVLKSLIVQVLRSGSPTERSAMFSNIYSPDLRAFFVRVCADTQFADSANPRTIALAFPPPEWLAGTRGKYAITDYLTWPGKPKAISAPARKAMTTAEQDRIALGSVVFRYSCASCHLASGEGSPGQVAPLKGSPTVLGDPRTLARVLIHGLEGEMLADGITYKGSMPAAVSLDDAKLAAVMSYIRTNFGNDAEPVDVKLVNEVRTADKDRRTPMTTVEIGRSVQRENPK